MAVYERGIAALQRREFSEAAGRFREVLERHPEEHELHERARLYLRVCEREQQHRDVAPQTLEERIYAATLALNAGAHAEAMQHLTRALAEDASSGHVHYMLAVVHARGGDPAAATAHLRQAVDLDPENRLLARRDPDFDGIRNDATFRQVVEVPTMAGAARRRPRSRLVR